MDQFDRVEKVFYGEEPAPSEKEGRKFKSIYKNAQIHEDYPLPFRPPFRFIVNAYQIAGDDLEKIFDICKRNSQLSKSFADKEFADLSELEMSQFRERVDNVIVWLENTLLNSSSSKFNMTAFQNCLFLMNRLYF